MRMIDDRTGIEVIDRDDSLALLGGHPAMVGRVAVVDGSHPVILPVNYAVDGEHVVFRTAPGTKLDSALHGANVAFEVDDLDPVEHTGWSVLVKGRAELVAGAREQARLAELPLRPWSDHDKPNWIRVVPDIVTGRRLSSPAHVFL